ncbi:MAG: hypothetical protein JST00_15080 [Deltaproteobacteria bacterium]|nr:hypothetical protein [Deltaproteobacteria bacterium]
MKSLLLVLSLAFVGCAATPTDPSEVSDTQEENTDQSSDALQIGVRPLPDRDTCEAAKAGCYTSCKGKAAECFRYCDIVYAQCRGLPIPSLGVAR